MLVIEGRSEQESKRNLVLSGRNVADAFERGIAERIVDVVATADPVADKFRIAIIAEFKIPYNPSCSWVHVSLQLHHLLRQSLCQRVQRIVGALVTTFGARIGFNRVEGSAGPTDGIVIITEECAGCLNGGERYGDAGW